MLRVISVLACRVWLLIFSQKHDSVFVLTSVQSGGVKRPECSSPFELWGCGGRTTLGCCNAVCREDCAPVCSDVTQPLSEFPSQRILQITGLNNETSSQSLPRPHDCFGESCCNRPQIFRNVQGTLPAGPSAANSEFRVMTHTSEFKHFTQRRAHHSPRLRAQAAERRQLRGSYRQLHAQAVGKHPGPPPQQRTATAW